MEKHEDTWEVQGLDEVFRKHEPEIMELPQRTPKIEKCDCRPNCRAKLWVCPYYENHKGALDPARLIEFKMFNHVLKCHKKFYNCNK